MRSIERFCLIREYHAKIEEWIVGNVDRLKKRKIDRLMDLDDERVLERHYNEAMSGKTAPTTPAPSVVPFLPDHAPQDDLKHDSHEHEEDLFVPCTDQAIPHHTVPANEYDEVSKVSSFQKSVSTRFQDVWDEELDIINL